MAEIKATEREIEPHTVRLIVQKRDGTVFYLEGDDLEVWFQELRSITDGNVMSPGRERLGQIKWKKADSLQDMPPFDTPPGGTKNNFS